MGKMNPDEQQRFLKEELSRTEAVEIFRRTTNALFHYNEISGLPPAVSERAA